MNERKNKDFFAKIWKCPVRRGWRYGRKILQVFIWGIIVWISLDFVAIAVTDPETYPPFVSLMTHALLTISFSLILTALSRQLFVRINSRFRPIRVFQPKRRSSHER